MLRGGAPADGVRPGVLFVFLVLVLAPACTNRPEGTPRKLATESPAPAPRPVANRWEPVAEIKGDGNLRSRPFDIASEALQWRVQAECEGATLEVRLAGAPETLVRPECPGSAFGFSIEPGNHSLEVAASGPWVVRVDQQLNTALTEPPLPGMTRSSLLAEGSFYDIDQSGTGEAKLYKLPGGRLALRFEPFRVTSNTDLFVWVSRDPEPETSEEALVSEHISIAGLKATGGPQNYLLPAGTPEEAARSVVIWCEPVRVAYAAATLTRQ